MKKQAKKIETATFGAGCFWHVQKEFDKLKGILKTEAGFMGGDENKYPNPMYEQVCSGKTGYAEVVNILFDPEKLNYEDLLEVFWNNHNPTEVDRQGQDIGKQYRSVIFYYNKEQKDIAEKSKLNKQKSHDKKIATLIVPAKTFFKAEEYHQKYLEKRGRNTCSF